MSNILDKLHQDHIHMAQVLDVLDDQLRILRHPEGRENADLNLLREIALYFMTFPEKVHHVAEDKMFTKAEQVVPDMKPAFEKLRSDHQNLSEVGKHFHKMMDSLCSGEVIKREQIIKEVESFLECQREHMNLEEGRIFPDARAGLDKASIAEIEAEYAAAVDPVFGGKVEDYFERIHEAIVARE